MTSIVLSVNRSTMKMKLKIENKRKILVKLKNHNIKDTGKDIFLAEEDTCGFINQFCSSRWQHRYFCIMSSIFIFS